jgi:hypothetical protein
MRDTFGHAQVFQCFPQEPGCIPVTIHFFAGWARGQDQ